MDRFGEFSSGSMLESLVEKKGRGYTHISFDATGLVVCADCLFRDGTYYPIDDAIAIEKSFSCSCNHSWGGGAYLTAKHLDEYEEAKRELGLSFSLRPCASVCSDDVLRLATDYLTDFIYFRNEWRRVYLLSEELQTRINIEQVYFDAERRAKDNRLKLEHLYKNRVRDKHGLPHVGEGWVNETALFGVVQGIFSDDEVIHHYRASWLGSLELDVYVVGANIGFEYQGIQHFEPQPHWGGEAAFVRGRERDAEKARRCADNGTRLVEVRYDEAVTEEVVRRKLGGVWSASL